MEMSLRKPETCSGTKKIITGILMYAIIFAASVFGAWILTYKGYPAGDDVAYHFSNIYDMYLQLKSGSVSKISSALASGLGFGKQLFYSPLSHLTTALLGVMLEPFGVSLLGAFKLNLFLSVFFSGVFMYHFGYHISKRRGIALIAALIYILYPYRFFDMFCRIAVAEAYAFLFIPLFFMGLYDMVHIEDERKLLPFLEIILGGSLLFLTHNITAAYAYIFGILYLIFNYKAIYLLIKKDKSILPYAIVSILLLVGIAAGTLFGVFELYQTKLYNCSFAERMWTNTDYLVSRDDFEWYSGIINLKYFNSFASGITTKSTVLEGLYFGLCVAVVFLTDTLLSKIRRFKGFSTVIGICLSLMLMLLLIERTEVRLAVYLFEASYFILAMERKFECLTLKEALFSSLLAILFFVVSVLFAVTAMFILVIAASIGFGCYSMKLGREMGKSPDFWFTVTVLCFTLILITTGFVWYIMPSLMRSIQFPWRLWAYMSFFVSMLAAMVLKEANSRMLSSLGVAGACFLLVVSQAIPEKTIAKNAADPDTTSASWKYEIDDSLYTNWGSIGACKEYFPYMFYGSDSYTSEYSNSLYTIIKQYINYTSKIGEPCDAGPVILEGKGEVELTKREAPVLEMTLTIEEDNTLVQLPLIYYPGYTVTCVDENGNTVTPDAIMTDGLVSFRISKGTYTVSTSYSGTTFMKLGEAYQHIAVYGLIIFSGIALIYEDKERRKKYYLTFHK